MRRRLCAIAVALLPGGCTVGPNYHAPPVLSGEAPAPAFASGGEKAFDRIAPLPAQWWRLYDDPVLDNLEAKALARNTDLRAALANLQQEQAALRSVQLQRTPQTSLTVDPSYGQASGDANGSPVALKPGPLYDAMESISYDLDLFGRLRRSIEASRADVGAAQAALDLARVNVAGSTASAYAGLCAAGLEITVTNRSIAIARQELDVTQRRFDAGITGINDVVRARTLLRQTAANLPLLEAQQRGNLYLLATLTGDVPEAFPAAVGRCNRPPLLRSPIPIGDGAGLIARRPDVREAERRLASAVAEIGVSTAALYPSVSIGGGFGTSATKIGHIVSNRAFTWNVTPLLTWSFPNLSVARAEVAAANAAARGALAQFDGTVLTALREAESNLVTLARQLDNERDLAAARDDAARANANTTRLYQGGIGEFLDTLDAERTLIEAENSLAQATAQVSRDQVALFMALGGGWEAPSAITEVPIPITRDRPHR